MEEIWKDVEGYEGRYQVSSLGRVKSLRYFDVFAQKFKPCRRIIKGSSNKDGYVFIGHNRVHRWVAKAFIPNPDGLPEVNHKDGNKKNNTVQNLEWVTHSDNVSHAYRIGLRKWTEEEKARVSEANKGKRLTERQRLLLAPYFFKIGDSPWNKGLKLSREHCEKLSAAHIGKQAGKSNPRARKVICVDTGEVFDCIKDAMLSKGIRSNNITTCCKGITQRCGGYRWEYAKE